MEKSSYFEVLIYYYYFQQLVCLIVFVEMRSSKSQKNSRTKEGQITSFDNFIIWVFDN